MTALINVLNSKRNKENSSFHYIFRDQNFRPKNLKGNLKNVLENFSLGDITMSDKGSVGAERVPPEDEKQKAEKQKKSKLKFWKK
jgi:hypothetical protein